MRPSRRLDCAIWELTLGCNLRCSHCGSSAGKPRPDELDTDEAFGVCEMLSGVGCREVSLMGGEPLLREDFADVGRCVKQLGMKLSVVSNGLLMDDRVDEISALKPEVVGISIDGMKENHETIRGAGTWDKAVHAIDLLRSRGVQVTVITTVSKINYADLPKLRAVVGERDANWQVQVAMPFGSFSREQTLSKEEYYATALFIAKERLRKREERVRVVGAHCYGYFSKVLPGCGGWNGCTAGISSIGITSDGGVVGCLSMGNDRFIEGNLREKELEAIWHSPESFRYTRGFTQDDLGDNCSGCGYGKRCGGGCNSVSISLTGEFHNDPYCFYAIEKGQATGRLR
jgi:radical SAM protein with 4Fe4S-binding SPASM domain